MAVAVALAAVAVDLVAASAVVAALAAVVRAVAASAGADDAPLRYILITQFMGKEVCFL